MIQSGRITIGLLVVLIIAAIASGADQRIVTVLFRLLEVVLLSFSLLEVVVRSLRIRLAFQKGWVIGKRERKEVVRISEQPSRLWSWTALEALFLLGAMALTAFWVWLLTQGWH
jgi:hypothetical protein